MNPREATSENKTNTNLVDKETQGAALVPTHRPNQQWDAPTKRIVAIVIAIILALIVYKFRELLTPLAIATLLAFILDPIVDFLEEKTFLSRSLATTLVFLILVAMLLGVLAAPVTAVASVRRLILSLQFDLNRIINDIGDFFNQPVEIWEYQLDLSDVYAELSTSLRRLVGSAAEGTLDFVLSVASGAIGLIVWVVFILIAAYYLVKDADRIVEQLDQLAPPGYRNDSKQLRRQITEVWNAFLRGQLLLGTAMAIATAIVDLAIGLPYAWALGLVAGVLEFVPYLGPIIAAIPAVLLAFLQGSSFIPLNNFWFAVLVAGAYIIMQQIENNFFVPRIMGRSLDLHPLAVMIAVLAGGRLGGILGVFLAAPTLATLRVIAGYILSRLYDLDPFPQSKSEEIEKTLRAKKETQRKTLKLQSKKLKQAGEAAIDRLQELEKIPQRVEDVVRQHTKRSAGPEHPEHSESADTSDG